MVPRSLTPIVIVGAGGHGRELADIVQAVNDLTPTFELLGFLDDEDRARPELERRDLAVLGPVDQLAQVDAVYVIGLGSGRARAEVGEAAGRVGAEPVSALAHPAATCGSDLQLGPGLVMAAGARITTNVTAGRHVHLNVNATLSHDGRVGDYVTLNPGAHVNGTVTLGDGVTVGSGAVVRQNCQVGASTSIGAGAVVVDDIPPGVTAVGVPARFPPGAASMDG